MKHRKHLTSMVLLVLILCLCIGMVPIQSHAAAEGTMISNAVQASFGSTYYKSWSSSNDHLNHYVTFTVLEQGIVTINATKPYDSEGEYCRLHFTVYDSNFNPVWGNDTYKHVEDVRDSYNLKVGLAAGTYYLTMLPGFYVRSGLVTTKYNLSFQANSYCEVEPNGDGGHATPVTQGIKYTGYFGSGDSDYEETDYFKVNVKAGTYRIMWYNYSAMNNTSTIVRFLMPDGNYESIAYDLGKHITNDGINYYDVKVKQTGAAYLYMYNYMGAQYEFGFSITNLTCATNGHRYSSSTITKQPTCTTTGTKSFTCYNCGVAITETIAATGHSWNSGTITKQPTCQSTGERIFTCTRCNTTSTQILVASKHTYSDNADQTCDVCGRTKVATLQKVNGVWKYYEDNEYTQATTLVKYQNTWYYVEKGQVNWNFTGVAKYGNAWFYIKKGMVDWTYTGLASYNGTWFYFKSGQLNWSFTGLCQYNGTWFYIKGGRLDWSYTGLCYYDNSWSYVKAGRLDLTFTGFCRYNNGWFYVKDGKLDWNYTGLGKYNGKWFYAKKGQLDWSFTGLCKYSNSWFYVSGGQVNWNYTGLCPLGNSLFYVKNGILDWSYNGTCIYNDTTYTVKGGIAQ